MINVLIPLAGRDQYFPETDYPFPKPLIEVCGKTIIERVIRNLASIDSMLQFIFVISSDDCDKYHLDSVLKILTNDNCKIVKLHGQTKGAACSAMMAVDYIANDMPLVISNADHLFDVDLKDIIEYFKKYDAGVISFESVHPRWSYARVNSENTVIETAEKRPLSKNAIAGFYYFSKGKSFIDATSNMIKKDASLNDLYYIAPCLNELVLDNKTIKMYAIDNDKYHTLYTPGKIKEYERLCSVE